MTDRPIGVVLPPQDPNLAATDLIDLAVITEKGGYNSVWLPEAWSWDVMCVLTAIGAATQRIQLGPAVITIPVRTPALAAMASATADYVSSGRFILGIGTGHRRLVEPWHGVEFQPKLKKLREYVEIIRRIHEREHMNFSGDYYRCVDAQIGNQPYRPRIPLYIAALALDTSRVAGEIADGLLPWYAVPSYFERIAAAVVEGANLAGRDPADIDLALMIPTVVTNDVPAAREMARGQIAWYNNFEFYNRMFREAGFEDEAMRLSESWAKINADPELKKRWEESRDADGADAGTAEFVSDEMVDSLFVIGDARACRERIESYRELGVTQPLIFPQGVYKSRADALAGYSAAIEGIAPAG